MSTTFGIKIKTLGITVEVAHRASIGNGKVLITITNPLVYKLKAKTKLIAMDNSSQGIYTISDLLVCSNIVDDFKG